VLVLDAVEEPLRLRVADLVRVRPLPVEVAVVGVVVREAVSDVHEPVLPPDPVEHGYTARGRDGALLAKMKKMFVAG
jgi:hypothetical protein